MNLGIRKSYSVSGQKVQLTFEKGDARIEIISDKIIHVFRGLETPDPRSYAIESDPTVPTEFTVEDKEDGLWIRTRFVTTCVSDGFYVDFYDNAGNPVCTDYRGDRKPLVRASEEQVRLLEAEGHSTEALVNPIQNVEIVKKMQGSEHFYGLGDKTGFLDKRHYDYVMWNSDLPDPQVDSFRALYKSIPFLMTLTDTHAYGLFWDNTYKSVFNMGQESEDYFYIGAAEGNLDYYYIAGENLPDVLHGYTGLTGRTPLPQKWTLGYQQCRWGYMTQEDVQEVAQSLRALDIPCDSIHLDIDYMEGYRVFTWNRERYHNDPEAFLKRMADDGFKMVTIIDPGVKVDENYEVYRACMEKGFHARTPDGKPYTNDVWPGEVVYPDFGNPDARAWWGQNHKFLVDKGVRGIWNDMNEPASFNGPLPDDVVFTNEDRPAPHRKMHNVYGHLMAKATYEAMKELDGRRPYVITRACYAGSQKYATAWTGDNHSIWAHLQMAIPQLCNLGLSGLGFVGTDVGGFGSDTTPELLTRWVQVGCFSPLFRNHSCNGTRQQEPWRFGQEVLDIYRKYVKLRYSWIPYFYDLFRQQELTGDPIMRPLVYHYEKDENARVCNDEFMVGSQVLVAPVVTQGATRRMVYLPEGTWYDYWTREKLEGKQWLIREAPLDTCPIYVKAGSIIPTMADQSYIGQKDDDRLILDVFPGEGSYVHYRDNGEDFAYRDGAYTEYRFTVDSEGQVRTELLHDGYKPYGSIEIRK